MPYSVWAQRGGIRTSEGTLKETSFGTTESNGPTAAGMLLVEQGIHCTRTPGSCNPGSP